MLIATSPSKSILTTKWARLYLLRILGRRKPGTLCTLTRVQKFTRASKKASLKKISSMPSPTARLRRHFIVLNRNKATVFSFAPERSTQSGRGCWLLKFNRQATQRFEWTIGAASIKTENLESYTSRKPSKPRILALAPSQQNLLNPPNHQIGIRSSNVTNLK